MAARPSQKPLVSVIAAIHNEEGCLRELVARVRRALADAPFPVEIVLVDDGSTDGSFDVIASLAAEDACVHGVRLARNEGHESALMCGMALAQGDVVVTLDADLQHPPEHIPEMLRAWGRGYDVVHMRRKPGHEGWLRAALTRLFYRLFNTVSDVDVPPQSTDFRLLDRACLRALSDEWRRRRFLRAAARGLAVPQTELAFDAPARFAGTPSYTVPKLLALGGRVVLAAARGPRDADRVR